MSLHLCAWVVSCFNRMVDDDDIGIILRLHHKYHYAFQKCCEAIHFEGVDRFTLHAVFSQIWLEFKIFSSPTLYKICKSKRKFTSIKYCRRSLSKPFVFSSSRAYFLYLLQFIQIKSGLKLHCKETLYKFLKHFSSNELWVHLSTQSFFISHRKLFFDFIVVVIVWNHLMCACVCVCEKFFNSIDECANNSGDDEVKRRFNQCTAILMMPHCLQHSVSRDCNESTISVDVLFFHGELFNGLHATIRFCVHTWDVC